MILGHRKVELIYDLRKYYFTNMVLRPDIWNSLRNHVVLSDTVNIN